MKSRVYKPGKPIRSRVHQPSAPMRSKTYDPGAGTGGPSSSGGTAALEIRRPQAPLQAETAPQLAGTGPFDINALLRALPPIKGKYRLVITQPITIASDAPVERPFHSTFQDAIKAAKDGDVVVVAPDTYWGTGNRDIAFKGKAIAVRGLTGDPMDCIVDVNPLNPATGDRDDRGNHRGFIFDSKESLHATVLSGVTIRHGRVTGHEGGGGLLCKGNGKASDAPTGSPTIEDCIIEDCLSSADGGGLLCTNGASPALIRCTLQRNHATDLGGGIAIRGPKTTGHRGSNPTFSDCKALANVADRGGGGAAIAGVAFPFFADCVVSGNQAGLDGGGLHIDSAIPRFRNTHIADNTAGGNGGGIWMIDSKATLPPRDFGTPPTSRDPWLEALQFMNCRILNNVCASGGLGGGLFVEQRSTASADLTGVGVAFGFIVGNKASAGGGLYIRRGHALVFNAVISDNAATLSPGSDPGPTNAGGGACIEGAPSRLDFVMCTVCGNSALRAGGGLHVMGAQNPDSLTTVLRVWNTIVYRNTASQLRSSIGRGTALAVAAFAGQVEALFSDIEGYATLFPRLDARVSKDLIDVDPMLIPLQGDYPTLFALDPESGCKMKGERWRNFVPLKSTGPYLPMNLDGTLAGDLVGGKRWRQGCESGVTVVLNNDIGAYELQVDQDGCAS